MSTELMHVEENSTDLSTAIITRTAINFSARLGSLYDGCRDLFVGQLNVDQQEKGRQICKSVQCELTFGNDDQPQNLLRQLPIDEQSRLNMILGLTPSSGIRSVIDYPNVTDEYTRFFSYSYVDHTDQLSDRMRNAEQSVHSSIASPATTHIVVGIDWGIHLFVIFQLPSDAHLVKMIDPVLEKILFCSAEENNPHSLSSDEASLLEKIVCTKAYANTPGVNKLATIYDVCRYVQKNIKFTTYYPISYTLRPIQWFSPRYYGQGGTFIPLSKELGEKIEDYVLQLREKIKRLDISVTEDIPHMNCEALGNLFSIVRKQWSEMNSRFTREIERISNLVVNVRSGRVESSLVEQLLHSNEKLMMENSLHDLTENLKALEKKARFIFDLHEQQFQYLNVNDYVLDGADTILAIEQKLIQHDQYNRILCSHDCWNKDDPEQLDHLRSVLMEERKNNRYLRLIYADFSYSSIQLTGMIILPSSKEIHEDVNDQTLYPHPTMAHISTSSSMEVEKSLPSPGHKNSPNASSLLSASMSTEGTINILLLGETGVGKSTFINAFANYLRFNTLDQAQSGQPIVLIPVSFLITTGHNFVERNITFGDADQSNNEDFDHPGHSVTQHCRSYLFQHLDHTHIRLIDTPGFGDTRGVDQDDHNMQHIIEYVKSLSHINAVCFLLKPNESRLNIFFRSCLTQLFSLLGSEIGDNVVFCFTNCRSTFYTPGNTAPLLKKMLPSLSMDRVTLRKDNTFCFDSESFRYLVASQHKIEFDDDEKKEYDRSWSTSVTEANRLVHYISTQVGIYSLKKECQSIEDAKLEIVLMIRPILETVRNTFRNIISCRMSACKKIVLQPTALHRPATICLLCDLAPHLVGGFWIVRDLPHEIYEECVTCSCSLKQHIPMTYKLAHKVNDGMDSQHENDMSNEISLLLNVCVDFACFLTHVTHLLRDDPFESALKRMIDEESNICRNQRPNQANSELIKELKKFQSRYEQRMKEMKSKEEHHELSVIYDCIKTMHKYPVVREQMASIKEQRSIIKKHNESEVQENGSGARL